MRLLGFSTELAIFRDASICSQDTETMSEEAHLAAFELSDEMADQVTTTKFERKLGTGLLAIGRQEGRLDVVDVETGSTFWSRHEHSKAVNDICWSSDREILLTASSDGTARIWDVRQPDMCHSVRSEKRRYFTSICAPNYPSRIFCCGDYEGAVLKFDNRMFKTQHVNHDSKTITSLNFSIDDRVLLSSSVESTTRLYQASSFVALRTFGSNRPVAWSSFSTNNRYICSVDGNGSNVDMWDLTKSNKRDLTFRTIPRENPVGPVEVAAFNVEKAISDPSRHSLQSNSQHRNSMRTIPDYILPIIRPSLQKELLLIPGTQTGDIRIFHIPTGCFLFNLRSSSGQICGSDWLGLAAPSIFCTWNNKSSLVELWSLPKLSKNS